MNLFNYLMAKKGHNTSVRDDLLAYLLGNRTPKEVKTATGTTISITDVTREKIVSLTLSKESSQDGSPTPENPIEVKTVKGYRNLLDIANWTLGSITADGTEGTNPTNARCLDYISVLPNTTYSLSSNSNIIALRLNEYTTEKTNIKRTDVSHRNILTITTTENTYFIRWSINYDNTATITQSILDSLNLQITEGTEELPYVPYGTNYVYTAVSNGTDTNYYTIPLNDNEIAGIGTYKDELIVDKNGKCWLNKKIGKVVLDGTESLRKASATDIDRFIWDIPEQQRLWLVDTNSLSNYFTYNPGNVIGCFRNNAGTQLVFNFSTGGTTTLEQFKEWLSNNNVIIYQPLITSQLIDLNYTVDIELFKGINNISNSDDMDMTLKYY